MNGLFLPAKSTILIAVKLTAHHVYLVLWHAETKAALIRGSPQNVLHLIQTEITRAILVMKFESLFQVRSEAMEITHAFTVSLRRDHV